MQTQEAEPKYCDQCGSTGHTDAVALAACQRLLKPEDLDWLVRDLEMGWDGSREHLPEWALSIGAQDRYCEFKIDSKKPSKRCVSTFLKVAVFLFYADAVQQIENATRAKPISLAELTKLVTSNLEKALQPKSSRVGKRHGQTKLSTSKPAVSVRKSGKSSGGKKK